MKISKIVAGVLLALSIIATGCGNVKEEENKVEEKTEVSEVSSAENETEEKVIIGWINADTTTPSQIAKLNAAKEQAKQMNAELRVMDYQHDINKMIESIENLAAFGRKCDHYTAGRYRRSNRNITESKRAISGFSSCCSGF